MKIFLTTAIDYVNHLPHIGTAYEKIGADILARFYRLQGHDVLLQMGNDEHAVNVKKSAEKEGLSPKVYCDQMRPKFEAVWEKLHIRYDQFIQTSDPKHHETVKKLFKLVYDAGDIYEGLYEGLYCESCEAYYTEKDLVDGLCPNHKAPPVRIKEKNFFFRLTKYEKPLLEHIENNPTFILPASRRNEIINVIRGGLRDISVSRSSFDWGIPLPIKPTDVVYVWFDALINYLSLIGFSDDPDTFAKWWPADLHIIGKDITRFHCVIWPALLMSAKVTLPKSVFGHGFVYLKGEKMSKSLGNVVTPLDVVNLCGPDALRYYLFRSNSFGEDGNFTWEDFIHRTNSDLANGLGNLVSRLAGMITRYFEGSLHPSQINPEDDKIASQYDSILKATIDYLDPVKSGDLYFNRALDKIWGWIGDLDRYIDHEAPWALAKAKNEKRLGEVLSTVSKSLFGISILLMPFLPSTSEKIWDLFGWSKTLPFEGVNFKTHWTNNAIQIQKSPPLFPRIQA